MNTHDAFGFENAGPRQVLVVSPAGREQSDIARIIGAAANLQPMFVTDIDAACMEALQHGHRFDAVLLVLEASQGAGLCMSLRRAEIRIPILIASDAGEESDIVRGLAAGANDYLACPFRPREVMARIHAQIRAHETSEHAVLRIGPFDFHPAARLLHDAAENRRIRLTDKEAAVLKFLYRARGVPVGRQTLLREVWGYNEGASTHTVETHIYRLRRKIEPTAESARIVVNEDGGYRLAPQNPIRSLPRAETASLLHHHAPRPVSDASRMEMVFS